MKFSLPTDSTVRKTYPLFSGLFGYFAAALGAVAHHSWKSNEKHNPGQPVHWAVDKSTDHADCIMRHQVDLGDILRQIELHDSLVPDGYGATTRELLVDKALEEAAACAWRALAQCQVLHVRFGRAPLASNAKHSAPEPAKLSVAGYPSPRCTRCMTQPCSCKPTFSHYVHS